MTGTAFVFGFIVLMVVLVGVWAIAAYNGLVRKRNQVRSSWAQIDVQLVRRHSLIPNLVETVRGYASHEKTTLDSVIAARTTAMSAGASGVARAESEDALGAALGRLLAVAEAYPQLRANENFLALQEELAATENRIAYARQFYNSAAQGLNDAVQTFPGNFVAKLGSFGITEYYEASTDQRGNVAVRL